MDWATIVPATLGAAGAGAVLAKVWDSMRAPKTDVMAQAEQFRHALYLEMSGQMQRLSDEVEVLDTRNNMLRASFSKLAEEHVAQGIELSQRVGDLHASIETIRVLTAQLSDLRTAMESLNAIRRGADLASRNIRAGISDSSLVPEGNPPDAPPIGK
jgi:prefoldin subunit 5